MPGSSGMHLKLPLYPYSSIPNATYCSAHSASVTRDPSLARQLIYHLNCPMSRSVWKQLTQLLPWTSSAKDTDTLVATIQRFWERNTTDDLLFLFLVVIDAHIQEVGWTSATHQCLPVY